MYLSFFELFNRFKEGREEIGDNLCTNHPYTSKIDINIENVCKIVQKNSHLSIRAVAELAHIGEETVDRFYIKI